MSLKKLCNGLRIKCKYYFFHSVCIEIGLQKEMKWCNFFKFEWKVKKKKSRRAPRERERERKKGNCLYNMEAMKNL